MWKKKDFFETLFFSLIFFVTTKIEWFITPAKQRYKRTLEFAVRYSDFLRFNIVKHVAYLFPLFMRFIIVFPILLLSLLSTLWRLWICTHIPLIAGINRIDKNTLLFCMKHFRLSTTTLWIQSFFISVLVSYNTLNSMHYTWSCKLKKIINLTNFNNKSSVYCNAIQCLDCLSILTQNVS